MMKRVFNGLQWVALLAVVALITWFVLRPEPPVVYAPETWSNWEGFMTLSYAGVTRGGNEVYPSSETLASHLEALDKSGYRTITPEDALAFLEGRAPLPDKALLILFEGARKETFIRVHPVLRRLGMMASLCVPTESVESWDESRLKKRDVRKIALLPQWGLASMGHDAINPVEVSDSGKTDHFLSARKWLHKEKRVEDDAEFRARITEDYRVSSDLLGTMNGGPVAAYVYPFADDGRRPGADPLAAAVNYSCVTSHYRMAFLSASNPYNPPGRDRFALSRLRVGGDWSAAQVLTRLKHARPLPSGVAGLDNPELWSLLNGARVAGRALLLNSEDAAWIRGSELWRDTVISAVLSRSPGSVAALYARFVKPTDGLRLSVDEKTIRLQEVRGSSPVTLAVAPVPPGETLRLVWRLKGLRAWLMVDGVPVFGPVPLSEPRPSGAIGFESRKGKVTLSELSVTPIPRQGLLAESWGLIPDDRRAAVTEYFTPFPPPGQPLSAQQGLDFIQAVAEGAAVWPVLGGDTNGAPGEARVEALTAMLSARDMRPFIKGFVLDAELAGLADPLRRQGFKVMHRVRTGEPVPVAATNRVDYVWLEDSGSNGLVVARAFLHRHSPFQLVVRDEAIRARFPGVGGISEWAAPGGNKP